MKNFGMTKYEKEEREAEIKRREEEKAAEIAKRAAAREPAIAALREESNLSEKEFNKKLAHFGEEAAINNAYVQAVLLGKSYHFENSSKDLW